MVAVNVNALPEVTVSVAALVNAGSGSAVPAATTVSVIVWVAEPPALVAVIGMEYVPAATVPDSVPIPLPVPANAAPAGRVPLLSVGAG